jgi:tetratricopeptide (TPR) repeat protein
MCGPTASRRPRRRVRASGPDNTGHRRRARSSLDLGEETRVWRKRSGSPLVYEHFLKGRTLYINFAKHTHAQARSEFERALAINPAYTSALGMLGLTLTDQARFGWEENQSTTYELALECAGRALSIDPNSYIAYVATGYTRLFQRRHDDAVAAGETALGQSRCFDPCPPRPVFPELRTFPDSVGTSHLCTRSRHKEALPRPERC